VTVAAQIYIALLREQADGSYEVSFPDLPGVVTAGDTLDEAIEEAEETLEHAAETWTNSDGSRGLTTPRSFEQLEADPAFVATAEGATVVEIEFSPAG
jgi:antitoxin HicB